MRKYRYMEAIFVNIPCPTKKEAIKLCSALLKKELCATTKIHENVHLMWYEDNKVEGEEVVLITLKTTDNHIEAIHKFIFENHSWGNPCIEVVPILRDLC